MNIVVIVSDTLRRDFLGCYGNRTVRTPNIDHLAERSAVFGRYYAASFPTMPARADLLLGKWTFPFMGWDPLPEGEVPLPAILGAHNRRTVGVVDTPFYTVSGMGYDRGFQHFYDLDTQRVGSYAAIARAQLIPRGRRSEYDYCAPRTMCLAEQALERIYEDQFFLYVDTWDPHEPWDPPAWYVRPYKPDYDGRLITPPYADWRAAGMTEDDVETARACYAGEITMIDRWVGRLLERLESLGIADQTAIVLTSDHGFLFGEHGVLGKGVRRDPKVPHWHRSPLYEEIVHIPLIVHVPGMKPRRVPELVSAVDVMPTVLDLANVPQPEGISGRSLLPLVRGEGNGGRDFVVTSMPLANPGTWVRWVDDRQRRVEEFQPATITTTEWSMLYSAKGEPVELYDLVSDPGQAVNVASRHPQIVRDLHGRYVNLLVESGATAEHLEPRRSL